jgi:hypothetical protein
MQIREEMTLRTKGMERQIEQSSMGHYYEPTAGNEARDWLDQLLIETLKMTV